MDRAVLGAASEIQRMLPDHPEWNDDADVQAFVNKDVKALTENHNRGLVKLIGQDFMRVLAEETYGIVPQQVVGSYSVVPYETKAGTPTFVKTVDSSFVDDKNGKPEAIHRFIGRRPIACFGNSDGGQAMLEYTTLGNLYPTLGAIVHHTDAEREYACDSAPPSSGRLVTGLPAAKERGWTVIDMKNDWKTVFAGDE